MSNRAPRGFWRSETAVRTLADKRGPTVSLKAFSPASGCVLACIRRWDHEVAMAGHGECVTVTGRIREHGTLRNPSIKKLRRTFQPQAAKKPTRRQAEAPPGHPLPENFEGFQRENGQNPKKNRALRALTEDGQKSHVAALASQKLKTMPKSRTQTFPASVELAAA